MDDDDVIIQARDVVLRHQLREALHTSMHTKDINNIQQAIDDVDGARMRDVMNDDVIQAEELIRILQAERDAKARLLLRKKELARAIKPPDVITPVEKPDVTPVVNDVIIPIVDEREAEVAMMKQLLAEAMTSNNVTMLEIAMQRILDAGLYDIMKGLFDDATMTLELWKDRIAFKKSVADIPARYVSEVRSYTNPPPGVHHVMQATFILLGFNESQLKTWKDVQSRLGRGGTDSFRYRVVKRSVSQINQSEIERAREILYDITIDDAQNLSLLVNLFYRYCQATMEEWDANIDNL
uniref:uncharacterized protein LOC108950862 isoform X1 n=1 Tax=Ciona intestinalis TaxID=7719 RepID=UPI000EF45736|nr:uncharacterized protein LOC108950862 isoform X1 [Ciona intestinalis]|eukprot:XP_026695815.1 uncharacterized protein LOC108950862 isoform X1 [Ciona intestinalis]